jgi:transposase-like protein
MEPVTRKRYTAEFKAQAVELVGLGKPVPEVSEGLEIGMGVLYRWMRDGGHSGQSAQFGSAGGRRRPEG